MEGVCTDADGGMIAVLLHVDKKKFCQRQEEVHVHAGDQQVQMVPELLIPHLLRNSCLRYTDAPPR
jgi:hypothetical protein